MISTLSNQSDFLIKCNSCHKILALEERRRHAPSLSLVGRTKLILTMEENIPILRCVCGQCTKLWGKDE